MSIATLEELGYTPERIQRLRDAARPSIRQLKTEDLLHFIDLIEQIASTRPKPLGGRTAGEVFIAEARIVPVED
jgi:hypothetical protein